MTSVEDLRLLGYRVDSSTGSYRLIRMMDSSQAACYNLDGSDSPSGVLGILHSITHAQARDLGMALAQLCINRQAIHVKLPQWQPPALGGAMPGDTIPPVSYFPAVKTAR